MEKITNKELMLIPNSKPRQLYLKARNKAMPTLLKARDLLSNELAIFYKVGELIPDLPVSLGGWHEFMTNRHVWTPDPLWGFLDHMRPIKAMLTEAFEKGEFKGDCDDVAKLTCWWFLTRTANVARKAFIVNIPDMEHVISILHLGEFNQSCIWFSNDVMRMGFNSTLSAISDYVNKHYTFSNEIRIPAYVQEVIPKSYNIKLAKPHELWIWRENNAM